jgi:hypothetical protein
VIAQRSLADVSPAASETVVVASIPRISTTGHHDGVDDVAALHFEIHAIE